MLSPIDSMPTFYEQLTTALEAGEPFALGIISGIKGSSPQKQGAKALFFGDGRIIGTLGGGCLEAEIQDRARRALHTQTPAVFDLVLDHDTVRGLERQANSAIFQLIIGLAEVEVVRLIGCDCP